MYMTNRWIIVIAIFLMYFHISGLATTNILRLTASNTLPVLASKCCCDHCGAAIPPLLQMPMISYIVCKGSCRNCGVKIPVFPLILEATVFVGMCAVSALLHLTMLAVSSSFVFYELVRVAMVLLKGKRENQFGKQYLIGVLSMIPFYLCALFAAALYSIV